MIDPPFGCVTLRQRVQVSNTGFSDQEFDSWQRSLKDAGRPQVRLRADHGRSGAAAAASHSPQCASFSAAAVPSQDKSKTGGMCPNIPPVTLPDVPSALFLRACRSAAAWRVTCWNG